MRMQKPVITRATREELEWTAGMLAASEPWITLGITRDQCLEACLDPEYLVYVAHCVGRCCGALVLHRRGVAGSPYIKSIAVSEDFRGRGIGAMLMDFAEERFRAEARHIFLCVSSFNTRARAFYERQGYRAVGEIADYIIEGASEILMHKRLR
jgi:[ribosomal protein S18]-alanine N-acetyltransferase